MNPIPSNVLGIEGGATRTTVLFAGPDDEVIEQFTAGPANLRLMEGDALEHHLRAIRDRLPYLPEAIGIGLAGARLEADRERLRTTVDRVWPGIPCLPSDDLITALEAAEWDPDCEAQVLVLSGTGSCSLGRNRKGQEVKLGGRGHILGDRASACHIAQQALRALIAASDSMNAWPELGSDILAHLQLNEPEALIDWSLVASKTELASVAIPVFRAALRKEPIALSVLDRSSDMLAKDAVSTAQRLEVGDDQPVQFVFNGAVLLKNPEFARLVIEKLVAYFPGAVVTPLDRPSAWGSVELARRLLQSGDGAAAAAPGPESDPETLPPLWRPAERSPTEARHPASMNFSDLGISEGIRLMLSEDETLPAAILAEIESIEWTIERVIGAFGQGGRLFYIGAGTSGRLGVLDASECPPTFRAPADQVQGIIAGGRTALWSAVEGAEDDAAAGRQAVIHRGLNCKDVIIGISASGHAPFIWGGLEEAKNQGATVVLLTCHPGNRQH
ncbi:MAG: N-acetylmuramic acid 6-phosphate etherase, partial [Verrucomicrobiota bacterium]